MTPHMGRGAHRPHQINQTWAVFLDPLESQGSFSGPIVKKASHGKLYALRPGRFRPTYLVERPHRSDFGPESGQIWHWILGRLAWLDMHVGQQARTGHWPMKPMGSYTTHVGQTRSPLPRCYTSSLVITPGCTTRLPIFELGSGHFTKRQTQVHWDLYNIRATQPWTDEHPTNGPTKSKRLVSHMNLQFF